MENFNNERRKYERFDTDVKIYFRITYDIKTKVKFQILDKKNPSLSEEKYLAVSKNVSAGGLCFISDKKLNDGDILYLEVYTPNAKDPINMEGEVKWSKAISTEQEKENKFNTGVELSTVNGKSVPESIHCDKTYQIFWSNVLESVFGSFNQFAKNKCKEK